MSSEVNEYYFPTKIEADTDEILESEISLNESLDSHELTPHELYFDESLQTNEVITPEVNNSLSDDMMKVKREWQESEEQQETADDETVATFVTSAGQQLALYAVEDTDDVFAVAVYDETGQPPTNFQFLTKEDVERLIGEGAVRTIKKPTQIKTQTYHGNVAIGQQRSVSPAKTVKAAVVKSPVKIEVVKSPVKTEVVKSPVQTEVVKSPVKVEVSASKIANEVLHHSPNMSIDMPEDTNSNLFDGDSDCSNDLTYEDILESPYMFMNSNRSQKKISECVKQPCEDIERSTVQHLLLDDQSDSELTFDDIEKSLKTFGKSAMLKSNLNSAPQASSMSPEMAQVYLSPPMSPENSFAFNELPISPKPPRKVLQNTVLKQKHVPNALLGRKLSPNDASKTFVIEESIAFTSPLVNDGEQMSKETKDSPDSNSKIKRSRKQQLITVNRADSEIIIQPASLVSEEEEEVPKKRGRRKKKRNENMRGRKAKTTYMPKKRIPVSQRIRIEIIDIDVENDENNDVGSAKKIEEITLDDGKEKCSSDKENEVIMVGDSDDDIEQIEEITNKLPSPILQCEYCAKIFRQKRFLDTHMRDCPKAPSEKQLDSKLEEDNSAKSTDSVPEAKKEYLCKHCEAKFDVVVALARHYRQHNMKKDKKNKMNNNQEKKDDEDDDEDDDEEDEDEEDDDGDGDDRDDTEIDTEEDETFERKFTRMKAKSAAIIKTKKRRRLIKSYKSSLKADKKHCLDCGRWFSGVALLFNHYIQHSTSRTEKSMRRCQICRKIFRTRITYIHHMNMHSKVKLQRKIRLQRTTRQSTSNINTRKRGRPRKL